MFVVVDDNHSEHLAEFESFEEALEQLRVWAAVPWDEPPNQAPCSSWETCGRHYLIVDYADDAKPIRIRSSVSVLVVSHSGARWESHEPSAD